MLRVSEQPPSQLPPTPQNPAGLTEQQAQPGPSHQGPLVGTIAGPNPTLVGRSHFLAPATQGAFPGLFPLTDLPSPG